MNSIHTSNDTVPKDHHTEENENHRTNLNEHNDDVTMCDSDSSFLTDTQPTLSPRTPFVGIEDDDTNLTNLTNPQTEDLNGTKSLAFRVLVDIFEDDQAPRACVIQIFATDTVENFKYALEKASGIPMDRQRCVFSGQQLENSRHMCFDPNASASSVGDGYQIRPGDTCSLVVLTAKQAAAAAIALSASTNVSKSTKSQRNKSAGRQRRHHGSSQQQQQQQRRGQRLQNGSSSRRFSSTKSSSLKKLIGHTSLSVRSKLGEYKINQAKRTCIA